MTDNELRLEISRIRNFLNDGDDLTLPIRSISEKTENLEEKLQSIEDRLNKIYDENARMHVKVIYMFITLLGTVLGKTLLQYILG